MVPAGAQQYLNIQINDHLMNDIRLENAHVENGKFHGEGDRNDILTADEIDDTCIRSNGGRRDIFCCSEPGAKSGPQGAIDLLDGVTDARICTLSWKASMIPGTLNAFAVYNQNPRYIVSVGYWNESGTLGEIPLIISEM